MRTLAALFALSTVLAGAATPAAAAPPRVPAYDCGSLAAQVGRGNVWQTWFTGQREDLFDRIDTYTAAPCFTTQANCKAWLYWAQTDFPSVNSTRPCRKGV